MKIKKVLLFLLVLAFIPCIFLFTGCNSSKQIEIRVENDYVQWSYEGENTWTNVEKITRNDYCKVIFDSNGGSEVHSLTNVVRYSKIEEPIQPIKETYTFLGWYLGETKWDFNELVVSKDITLKAKWKMNLVGETTLSENTNFVFTRVLSPSMTSAGLNKGNYIKLKVNSFNPKQNYLGEIIAFYNYTTEGENDVNKVLVTMYDYGNRPEYYLLTSENSTIINGDGNLNNATYSNHRYDVLSELQSHKVNVYIHQIVGIYIDDSGNVYYMTKGTNNSGADTSYVRWDRVIGLYCENLGDIESDENSDKTIVGDISYKLSNTVEFNFDDVFVSVDYGKDDRFLGNITYDDSKNWVELPDFSSELEQSFYFTIENLASRDLYTCVSYYFMSADNVISSIKVYEGDYNSLTEYSRTSNNNYLVSGGGKITYRINIKYENKDCIVNNAVKISFEAKL